MDSVNVDLREKGLPGEETQNHAVRRQLVRNVDPISKLEKMRRKMCRPTISDIISASKMPQVSIDDQ